MSTPEASEKVKDEMQSSSLLVPSKRLLAVTVMPLASIWPVYAHVSPWYSKVSAASSSTNSPKWQILTALKFAYILSELR